MIVTSNTPTRQMLFYLSGSFPVHSNSGSKYTMVVYDYDINAILAEMT